MKPEIKLSINFALMRAKCLDFNKGTHCVRTITTYTAIKSDRVFFIELNESLNYHDSNCYLYN